MKAFIPASFIILLVLVLSQISFFSTSALAQNNKPNSNPQFWLYSTPRMTQLNTTEVLELYKKSPEKFVRVPGNGIFVADHYKSEYYVYGKIFIGKDFNNPLVLSFLDPLSTYVTFSEFSNNMLINNVETGIYRSFDSRAFKERKFSFPLSGKAETAAEFVFKIQSESPINISFTITELRQHIWKNSFEQMLFGIYYGIHCYV